VNSQALPLAAPPAVQAPRLSDEHRRRLAARVRLLSWLSLGYMAIEGGIAILAGVLASSIALIGFGLDSAIEGIASVVIIWRFTGGRELSHAAEERAQKVVAISFFLLAPYIAIEAVRALASGDHPETSVLGIAVTASSVVLMPALGVAKRRLGERLGSSATAGEGTQNLLCAAQGAAVLVGLAANAIAGTWWLDSLIALGLAAIAVREGRATWRGEGCCASDPFGQAGDPCTDDCCS
jgi:divalent metal cation (Fe/Co/Zn/Cd) transporter